MSVLWLKAKVKVKMRCESYRCLTDHTSQTWRKDTVNMQGFFPLQVFVLSAACSILWNSALMTCYVSSCLCNRWESWLKICFKNMIKYSVRKIFKFFPTTISTILVGTCSFNSSAPYCKLYCQKVQALLQ